MSARTCRSPSLAWTPRPAPQPSTPGWAVPDRAANAPAPRLGFATVVRMPPPFRHRAEKESRRSPSPAAALEERIEEIMDRVQKAGDNHVERVAAPEEYLTLTRAHEGATWFDAAWTEDLADSYLALGRVDDAVPDQQHDPPWLRRGHRDAVRASGEADALGARAPGQAPVAAGSRRLPRRPLDLCAGWHRVRRHRRPRRALEWLTTGLELALRTGDPEPALEQLARRACCLSALGRPSGEIQERAAQGEQGNTGER